MMAFCEYFHPVVLNLANSLTRDLEPSAPTCNNDHQIRFKRNDFMLSLKKQVNSVTSQVQEKKKENLIYMQDEIVNFHQQFIYIREEEDEITTNFA